MEAVLLALAVWKRIYRTLPYFFYYLIWCLCSEGMQAIARPVPSAYLPVKLLGITVDALFQLAILAELARSVVRYNRIVRANGTSWRSWQDQWSATTAFSDPMGPSSQFLPYWVALSPGLSTGGRFPPIPRFSNRFTSSYWRSLRYCGLPSSLPLSGGAACKSFTGRPANSRSSPGWAFMPCLPSAS